MARSETKWLGLVAALLIIAPGKSGVAQELPVLDPMHTQLILQEISGDAAYEHIRFMTQFHRPGGGANGLWAVAEYYDEKAREFGLVDVSLIKQDYSGRPWNAEFADLWIVEPQPERIASTLQSVLHLADYSRAGDVTGELVDVGAGTAEDLANVDVSGKIVLTYGSIGSVMSRAVGEGGALGIIWYPSPFGAQSAYPDQLRWSRVPRGSDGYEPTFAFGLSLRQGLALRDRIAQAAEPIVARAVVESDFNSVQGSEPWQVMVEAFIRGTEPGLGQDVVITGHLQEEGTSANDDASGTANVLEIARALNRLIEEGRIPRPRRNLRFWWVTEISSQRQYFADNPEASEQMWVNINQDMVGADQSQDVMRVQNITRLPAARFHFFNDVVESVIDYMVASNTSELAQLQAGSGFYPNPHLSHLGSQDRYNAKVIFFHNNTDHMTFTETPIGVPGTTFTNWPDNYIHSSDDQLWNIDRTQLGRNAASVALMAYTMANAGESSVQVFAAETEGRGEQRLGHNLRLGLTWIATSDDKAAAYHQALDQVRFAAARERLAIASLPEAHQSAERFVGPLLEGLKRRERMAISSVETAYRHATGQSAPGLQLSDAEQRLSDLTPVVTGGPEDFLTGRGRIGGVPGLHSLMSHEVLNAADGERTGLDIYRYVAAEAREAGDYYYGTVTAEAVLQYLENVAAAGLMRLR
jgi:hypothetical protein